MPCSAAALVTSGSLAAPSSMEYSVCTCRCTNESFDGLLLTGVPRWRSSGPFAGLLCSCVRSQARSRCGRTPQWSCVPDRRRSGGRPVGKTGGAEIQWRPGRDPVGGTSILALRKVYAEGLTERVGHRRTDPRRTPCPPPRASSRRAPAGGRSEPTAHGDVGDAGLLVLLAHGRVAGPLVEAAGADLRVQLDLPQTPQHRLPVQLGEDGGAVPATADDGVGGHAADHRDAVALEQPAGGDHPPGQVPGEATAEHVDGGGVGVVLLDLRRHALLVDEHPGAQRRDLLPVTRTGHLRPGRAHRPLRVSAGSTEAGTSRKRRSIAVCRSTGSRSEPVSRYSAAMPPPRTAVVRMPATPW